MFTELYLCDGQLRLLIESGVKLTAKDYLIVKNIGGVTSCELLVVLPAVV